VLKVEGLPGFDKLIPIASSGLYCFMSLGEKNYDVMRYVYVCCSSASVSPSLFLTHSLTHTHSMSFSPTHVPLSYLLPSIPLFSHNLFFTIFLSLLLLLHQSPLLYTEFAGCKPMKTTKVSVQGKSNLTVNFEEELWIPVWYGIIFFT
jgi:hypothetical protein